MAPLVRRSWAPRGCPPVLLQKGRHREKVSVAGALWLTPARDRLRLTARTLVNGYFNKDRVAEFLRGLLAEVGAPLVVVWDGGNMHRGDPIRGLLAEKAGGLWVERLPAYGSELMPAEQVWTWLKYDRLPNFAPHDAAHLDGVVRGELDAIAGDQERLTNLFHASRLPLPRTLLR